MRKRKTISVQDLKDSINNRNRKSTCAADVRHGWNAIISEALMETKNYRGYRFLTANEVPDGHKPGVVTVAVGPMKYEFPDESRICYL